MQNLALFAQSYGGGGGIDRVICLCLHSDSPCHSVSKRNRTLCLALRLKK